MNFYILKIDIGCIYDRTKQDHKKLFYVFIFYANSNCVNSKNSEIANFKENI